MAQCMAIKYVVQIVACLLSHHEFMAKFHMLDWVLVKYTLVTFMHVYTIK